MEIQTKLNKNEFGKISNGALISDRWFSNFRDNLVHRTVMALVTFF